MHPKSAYKDETEFFEALRDDFAAKALQSIIPQGTPTTRAQDAEEAYRYADAMLKARRTT